MTLFKLSWTTAGCDGQSPSECDAPQSQWTLKFAILQGPPGNDAVRTWVDTPTPQGSILFFLEKMQRHPLWLLHWNQVEIFVVIPCTDSSRSACASVNMLQQMYSVCCSHRLLNNSYDCHTAKFYQWVILWVKKGKTIFILLWDPEQPLKLFSLKGWICYGSSVISTVIIVYKNL